MFCIGKRSPTSIRVFLGGIQAGRITKRPGRMTGALLMAWDQAFFLEDFLEAFLASLRSTHSAHMGVQRKTVE